MPIFIEKLDWGVIFDLGTIFSATKGPKEHKSKSGERPCRDPASHEIIVITAPLAPTGFQKVVF